MDEKDIISLLLSKITNHKFLKNDAFPLDNLVITKDVLVENVHFFSNAEPKKLAKKCLRVNLSDLASMGSKPIGYFLGLVLNNNSKRNHWLEEFTDGLKEDHKKYNIQLFGGDTVMHSGSTIISITMIGEKATKTMTRSGANIGDLICISGNIGDSYLGLLSYQSKIEKSDFFQQKYDLPEIGRAHV